MNSLQRPQGDSPWGDFQRQKPRVKRQRTSCRGHGGQRALGVSFVISRVTTCLIIVLVCRGDKGAPRFLPADWVSRMPIDNFDWPDLYFEAYATARE